MGLFFYPLTPQSMANSNQKEIRLPEPVTESLQYILGLLDTEHENELTMTRLAPIIDFVNSQDKTWPVLYYAKDNIVAQSAYHEFNIDQGIESILKYAYTRIIPSQALTPSSIRLSYWKHFNGVDHGDS